MVDESENLPEELKIIINNIKEAGRIADVIATNMDIDLEVERVDRGRRTRAVRLPLGLWCVASQPGPTADDPTRPDAPRVGHQHVGDGSTG